MTHPDEPSAVSVTGDRYVEVMQRLHRITAIAAGVIMAFTVASLWGKWRMVAIVLAINVVMLASNMWITTVLLKRAGADLAETVRLAFNSVLGATMYHFIDWPLPVWFWLPFIGLTFDPINRRVALRTLVVACLVQDAVALWDGVPWMIPLAFTALAFFCWEMSNTRFGVIRDMLRESDTQRREIEEAHAAIEKAHRLLREEVAARQQVEAGRRQAQKLESIGRLASGIAHEINTPVQFVSDNVGFLREASGGLFQLLAAYQSARVSILEGMPAAEALVKVTAAERAADLGYLTTAIPEAIQSSVDGLDRIAAIVRSMKEFAHPGESQLAALDINRSINNTLMITKSEYQHVADVEADLGELPPITGHAGELNQLLLNIVVNAAQAIGDVVRGTEKKGRITVRTRRSGGDVLVTIHDTGAGIPEGIQDRIFDPFFTTKDVGKGTGQGLSIASSIVKKHGWTLTVASGANEGTTFSLRLPVAARMQHLGAAA